MDNSNVVRCRVCRQIELYGHLRALYIASADAPTDVLRLSIPGYSTRFIATPADLHDFVDLFMVGYVDAGCVAHRNSNHQQNIVVLFLLDREREVVEPTFMAERVSQAERFAIHEAAVERRILSEVLDVTMLLYENLESRYSIPLVKNLRVGPHYYVQTQHWLTMILKYLCDSCCFGHSHLSEESLSLQSGALREETLHRAQGLLQLQTDRAALSPTLRHDNTDDENDRARRRLLQDTDDEEEDEDDEAFEENSEEEEDEADAVSGDENDVVAEIMLQPRAQSQTTRLLQYGRTLYAYCDPCEMEE